MALVDPEHLLHTKIPKVGINNSEEPKKVISRQMRIQALFTVFKERRHFAAFKAFMHCV